MIETRILSQNRPAVCKHILCYKVSQKTYDKIKILKNIIKNIYSYFIDE